MHNEARGNFNTRLWTTVTILLIMPMLLGHVALVRGVAGYSHRTFPWTICRSVGQSVCPVHCGKTADRIRMPFGIIGRTGLGMRQVVGFGDQSTGRGTFGACHCNQWGLTFAATCPSSQITLGRLVYYCP